MITLDSLRSFGADVNEGLGRMMNNEAFYVRLVGMALDDRNFAKLENAIAAEDLDTAFEAAHALKGILANLSLTPMTKTASELTELLRSRTKMDYSPLLKELMENRDKLIAMKE